MTASIHRSIVRTFDHNNLNLGLMEKHRNKFTATLYRLKILLLGDDSRTTSKKKLADSFAKGIIDKINKIQHQNNVELFELNGTKVCVEKIDKNVGNKLYRIICQSKNRFGTKVTPIAEFDNEKDLLEIKEHALTYHSGKIDIFGTKPGVEWFQNDEKKLPILGSTYFSANRDLNDNTQKESDLDQGVQFIGGNDKFHQNLHNPLIESMVSDSSESRMGNDKNNSYQANDNNNLIESGKSSTLLKIAGDYESCRVKKRDGVVVNNIEPVNDNSSKYKPSCLVCVIGGTNMTSGMLKYNYERQGADDYNFEYLRFFDGPNTTASDMEERITEIVNTINKNNVQDGDIVTLSTVSRGCFVALGVLDKLPNINFRLDLSSPTKGPFDNPYLKRNYIPKNAILCLLHYPAKEFKFVFEFSHSLLWAASPNTKLLVSYFHGGNHNTVPGYTVDYLRKFNLKGNGRQECSGASPKNSIKNGTTQHLIRRQFNVPNAERVGFSWKTTLPNGDFKYYDKKDNGMYKRRTMLSGEVYMGYYKNGLLNGKGKITYPDGTTLEGEFKDGELNGQGKITYRDGRIAKGEFEYGKLALLKIKWVSILD